MDLRANRHWYAFYTKPRHEKIAEADIHAKGYATYLPLRQVLRQWSDRKKWVDEPLFRGYVFVHANPAERYYAVQSRGVVNVVSFHGEPAVVRDEEITTLQNILKESKSVEHAVNVIPGERIEIFRGPLIGLQGILEEYRGETKIVVSIPSIQQYIRLCVDLGDVKRV